jgi:dipeptidyl aminopeptidase/acylaminoacyl peptidase
MLRRRFLAFLVLGLAIAVAPALAQRAPESQTPLIPLRDFFAHAGADEFRVSPDGQKIAWVARADGKRALHVRQIGQTEARIIHPPRELVPALGSPETSYWWARDSRRIYFLQDANGDENQNLFVVDTEGDQPPRNLTQLQGARVQTPLTLANDVDRILIRHNARDRRVFDLVKIHLGTGETEVVAENPGDVTGWWVLGNGQIRSRTRALPQGGALFEVLANGAVQATIRLEPGDDFRILGSASGGQHAWALSNRGRDRLSLVRVSLSTGEETLLHDHPLVDLSGGSTDGQGRMRYTWAWPGFQQWRFWDAELETDLQPFLTRPRSWMRLGNFDARGRLLTVYVGDERGGSWYLLDRQTRQHTVLAESGIARWRDWLTTTEPVQWRARDGRTIHGYLTRPRGARGATPMVVRVHGGPWARDFWGYSAINQFLANRGYAVLQVDYRGSRGYGRAFLDAGIRESGLAMLTDVADGARWATERGYADRRRIAIMGGSYGGYQTLAALAFAGETFAAGVASVPLTDLVGWWRANNAPYWELSAWWSVRFFGDPEREDDRRRMWDRSPVNRLSQIKAPLLLMHGANDVRVPRSHSDRVVEGLRALGRAPEYIVFDDEGHGINQTRNWLTYMRAVERFLARQIGGREGGES